MDGEVIPADAVVVAMGPWSGQAAQWGLPVPAVSGQKATSIVLRPKADISADMLFLEYRSRSGACITGQQSSLMAMSAAIAIPLSLLLSSVGLGNTSSVSLNWELNC